MVSTWPILDTYGLYDLNRVVLEWAQGVDAKQETPESIAGKHCLPVESVVYALGNFYFDVGESKKALALVNSVLDLKPDLRLHILRIRIRMVMPKENNDRLYRDMALLADLHFPSRKQSIQRASFAGWDLDPAKRLTLGFLCTFSNTWSLATILEPLLKRLDRTKFKVVFFSIGRTVVQPWLASSTDECVILLSDESDAICCAVKDQKIDLLFDLCGYLRQDLPLDVFARRPSPVQASWWNAPPAFGFSTMQYYLSEKGVLPEKYQAHFLEKIYLLGEGTSLSFEFPDYPLTPFAHTHQPFFTFGSFTALYKINDDVLSAWGEILQKAPHTKLFIKALHALMPYFHNRVHEALKPYKIDPSRILYEDATTFEDTMSKYSHADLCLDTYSYGGVTTSTNALWQGIPTLAIAGELLQATATADVMRKASLPQFVAKDREEYIRKAVYFACHPQELIEARRDLRPRLKQMARFNPDLFVPGFEEACRSMWQDWLKDYHANADALEEA